MTGDDAAALHRNLLEEYYAIMKVVSEYDSRLMIIKGWSVTLSLAGIGLAFSEGHYSLFALAAFSAGGFWYVETLMKQHQLHYYARMRDIEVSSFHLEHLNIVGRLMSAPQIDWSWGFNGKSDTPLPDRPQRRSPAEVRTLLARAPWMPWVAIPHALAVVLGVLLFVLALTGTPGFSELKP